MTSGRIVGALAAGALVLAAGACSVNRTATTGTGALVAPAPAAPPFELLTEEGVVQRQVFDLTEPGAVAWGTTEAVVIDTLSFPQQIQDVSSVDGQNRRVKLILPPHQRPGSMAPGENGVEPDGELASVPRATVLSSFTALNSTGWVPPDPALAVGPDHVVVSVNQSLAFYSKTGSLQFQAVMGSQGSPGFFEPVGASTFTFDPKCFYDHYAGRFVVLALEVYSSTAYITFAVSDDSNPNGVWYKYRTDAVINVGGDTYWWDYPGLGFDEDAYYVTSNLFGLNNSGFAGAGFRVFDKTPLLSGQPAVYATLRDGGSASVQACQHFGDNPAAYFVSEGPGASMRIHAIRDARTAPTLTATDVTVPGYSGAGQAPVAGGGLIDVVGSRMMNCAWRNGKVWAGHSVGGTNKTNARWYEFDTGTWPVGPAPTLAQVGQINMGSDVSSFFPAIYPNADGSVGLVFGSSSPTERVAMYVTGRNLDDAPGEMGDPVLVRRGDRNGTNGRWGDYYDIAIDPNDLRTFWAVGQTDENAAGGWDPWVGSFSVTPAAVCAADCDGNGTLNVDDIDCFAAGFFSGNLPAADCDGNGILNVDDVDCFAAAFLAGCN